MHARIPHTKDRPAQIRPACLLILAGVLLVLGLGSPAVKAQSGGDYGLAWSSAGDGGEALAGGAYMLYGAPGQPEAAGPQTALTSASGGSYTVVGGVFSGGETRFPVYLPEVER